MNQPLQTIHSARSNASLETLHSSTNYSLYITQRITLSSIENLYQTNEEDAYAIAFHHAVRIYFDFHPASCVMLSILLLSLRG